MRRITFITAGAAAAAAGLSLASPGGAAARATPVGPDTPVPPRGFIFAGITALSG